MAGVQAWRLVAIVMVVLVMSDYALAGRNYYKVLGVSKSANKREIKRAYRRLSREAHPDKNPDDPEAEAKFMEISKAYEVLTDDEKRRIYDRHGEEGLKKHNNGGGGGWNPFSMFQKQQHDIERKGESVEIPFPVSLKDLYVGRTYEASFAKQTLCPTCHGTGAKNPDDVKTCPVCHGRGVTITRHQVGPGFVQQMQTTCDKCGGKGKIVTSRCPKCGGTKVVPGESRIEITVEQGMPDGHRIEFPMHADQSPDMVPGDVTFVVHTDAHPLFERRGNDLHASMEISLAEALLGFEAEFEHLDGHRVVVGNPGITSPGQVLRVPGEGMPLFDYPERHGDLDVTITIAMPTHLSEHQRALLKQALSPDTA